MRGSRGRGSGMQRRQRQRPLLGKRDRLERVRNESNNRGGLRGIRGRGFGGFRSRFGFNRPRGFGMRSIFISGLPAFINNFKLQSLLKREGRVLRCNVLKNNRGVSRGIAFAEFQSPREAYEAVKKWNGKNIGEYSIYVAFKRPSPGEKRFFRGGSNNNMNFNNQYNNYNRTSYGYGGFNRGRGFGGFQNNREGFGYTGYSNNGFGGRGVMRSQRGRGVNGRGANRGGERGRGGRGGDRGRGVERARGSRGRGEGRGGVSRGGNAREVGPREVSGVNRENNNTSSSLRGNSDRGSRARAGARGNSRGGNINNNAGGTEN